MDKNKTKEVIDYQYKLRNKVLEEMKTVELHEMKYYSRFLQLICDNNDKEEGGYID